MTKVRDAVMLRGTDDDILHLSILRVNRCMVKLEYLHEACFG